MSYQIGLRVGLRLGLHTLAILAIVAASTAVLVAPELFDGPASLHAPLRATLSLGHG